MPMMREKDAPAVARKDMETALELGQCTEPTARLDSEERNVLQFWLEALTEVKCLA